MSAKVRGGSSGGEDGDEAWVEVGSGGAMSSSKRRAAGTGPAGPAGDGYSPSADDDDVPAAAASMVAGEPSAGLDDDAPALRLTITMSVPPLGAAAAAGVSDPHGPYHLCHRLLLGADAALGPKPHSHGLPDGTAAAVAVAVARALGAAALASEASRVVAFASGAFFSALWGLTGPAAAAGPRTPRRAAPAAPTTTPTPQRPSASLVPAARLAPGDEDGPPRFAGLRGRPYASVLSDPFDDDGLGRGNGTEAAPPSVGYF